MTNAPPPPGPLSVSGPWDLVSVGYAAEAHAVMLPFTRDAIDLVDPDPTARVLDVAAGTGMLTLELAPRVARVDAVDFSKEMLARLEEGRAARGLSNVHAGFADGQALPFENATFDAAFSMFGLMFFPDRRKGFAELYRVLKPGARAAVSSWAPVERSPLMILMFGALRAADPSRSAPQTNLLSLENPTLFEQELREAGFRDVKVQEFTHSVKVDDAETYWNTVTLSSAPIALLKERLGPEEWKRQSELALAYLRDQIPAAREFATTAHIGIGTR
jgi:ubiquinone/menaquinone biosynthesis C-methylase UbiE